MQRHLNGQLQSGVHLVATYPSVARPTNESCNTQHHSRNRPANMFGQCPRKLCCVSTRGSIWKHFTSGVKNDERGVRFKLGVLSSAHVSVRRRLNPLASSSFAVLQSAGLEYFFLFYQHCGHFFNHRCAVSMKHDHEHLIGVEPHGL